MADPAAPKTRPHAIIGIHWAAQPNCCDAATTLPKIAAHVPTARFCGVLHWQELPDPQFQLLAARSDTLGACTAAGPHGRRPAQRCRHCRLATAAAWSPAALSTLYACVILQVLDATGTVTPDYHDLKEVRTARLLQHLLTGAASWLHPLATGMLTLSGALAGLRGALSPLCARALTHSCDNSLCRWLSF